MTPDQIADALLAGESPKCGEAEMTAACDVLRERLTAAGKPVPATEHAFESGPLVDALKGATTSAENAEDVAVTVTRLSGELAKTKSALVQERTAHASTRGELEKLKASVASNEELAAAKAEVVKLQGEIVQLKRDHEAALKSLDFDVDQRAAAKIVAIGIREPKAGEHEAYVGRTETLTERCRRAAGIKAN